MKIRSQTFLIMCLLTYSTQPGEAAPSFINSPLSKVYSCKNYFYAEDLWRLLRIEEQNQFFILAQSYAKTFQETHANSKDTKLQIEASFFELAERLGVKVGTKSFLVLKNIFMDLVTKSLTPSSLARIQKEHFRKMDLIKKQVADQERLNHIFEKTKITNSNIEQAFEVLCARSGSLEDLQFLLDMGATNIEVGIFSALHSSKKENFYFLFDLYLKTGATSEKIYSFFIEAIKCKNRLEVLNRLLDVGLSLNMKIDPKDLEPRILEAMGTLKTKRFSFLFDLYLKSGITADTFYAFFLKAMKEKSHKKILQKLLQASLNIHMELKTKDLETAILTVLSAWRIENFDFLLNLYIQKGANPESLYVFLMEAIKNHNKMEFLQKILDAGLDINLRITNENLIFHKSSAQLIYEGPLIFAIKKGNRDAFDFLLKAGAQLDLKDSTGRTALRQALISSEYGIMEQLLQAGDKGEELYDDFSIFSHAIAMSPGADMKAIHHFIKYNLDINMRDGNGNTPLMAAIIYEQDHVVTLLLEHNPDLHAKNNAGYTAVDLAKRSYQAHIVKTLKEHMNPPKEKNKGTPSRSSTFWGFLKKLF